MHTPSTTTLLLLAVLACGLGITAPGHAEQTQKFGNLEVHYIVFPTTLLSAEIANQYNIVRARDRALLNISILDADGNAVKARVTGSVKNLPGQILALRFNEVVEQPARYYLAEVRFTDQEIMRFVVEIEAADGKRHELKFEQKLYWEE
jgi:hypothetical protein